MCGGADQASVKNTFLAAGVSKAEAKTLDISQRAKKEKWADLTEGHRTTQAISHAREHGST